MKALFGAVGKLFSGIGYILKSLADPRLVKQFGAGVAVLALGFLGYIFASGSQIAEATAPAKAVQAMPQGEPSARAPIQLAQSGQFTAEMIAQAERLASSRFPEVKPAEVPPLTAQDTKPQVATSPAPATDTPPAPQAPAVQTSTPAPVPAVERSEFTGKDLIKAPLATNLPAGDSGIAEKLREILSGRYERLIDRREDRAAVEIFYRDRGFAPIWIQGSKQSPRAASAIRHLQGIGADALYPQDYPVPNFNAPDVNALAEAELKFTNSILDYTRHAQTGRMHFTRLDGDIHYDLVLPDPAETLAKMGAAQDVASILDSYNPQHPGYKALKAKLAELRGQAAEAEVTRIPDGPTLKVGMDDKRVPLLRKRLGVANEIDTKYDKAVADAVAAFQKKNGLNPDGVAGPGTIKTINGPVRANRLDTVMVNMERWRWMPRDLGQSHVMVNIPDFTMRVIKDGEKVWDTRVIVGRKGRESPLMVGDMKFITVNPTWNVPPSIIAKDYLPALQQDREALTRIGVKVEENKDGTVRMYQPPGDNNALGRLRFNFPNKFLVYQHDTPDKKLFERDARAYSAGCIRVQDPVKYAELLLSIAMPKENYTQQKIRGMYGNQEYTLNFQRTLPVHLTYQTAFVNDAGELVFRDDVYGRDTQMIGIMKENTRKVADTAVPKRIASYNREELRMPNGMYVGGNNDFANFFRGLFGGGGRR
jgi:murein L,D-transpeptidase YcbB/YkuD